MTQELSGPPRLFAEDCGVCGKPLVYASESAVLRCAFCGKDFSAQIRCPEGHYVCDVCHQAEATTVLRQVIAGSTSTDPLEMLERIMAHPSVTMHGPEHHPMVPAVIVAAARNAGYGVPDGAIEEAITRGGRIPGGWCGFYGACGAGVGIGVAVSVLTSASPLKGKQRTLAIKGTSLALARIADGYPRCCKRATRLALGVAQQFLNDKLDISLTLAPLQGKCAYSERNHECPKKACPYF
ncbi:MAG: DUF5714 domain-containing protein [Dehalococcoidia bacterium]|nr:DUF5714 domain-containing protein [Dehalococcoidia bacterium]